MFDISYVIWLITIIFSILMVIYITPRPLFRITNPTYHNFNQPSVSDWFYPNQYNPCPQSYDHNFQINFNSSQSQRGFTSSELNFQPHCPQFPQYITDSASFLLFLNHRLRKNHHCKGLWKKR